MPFLSNISQLKQDLPTVADTYPLNVDFSNLSSTRPLKAGSSLNSVHAYQGDIPMDTSDPQTKAPKISTGSSSKSKDDHHAKVISQSARRKQA